MEMKDYQLEHLKLMHEEDIKSNELPAPIKNKLNSLNMLVGRYNANPTEELKQMVIKHDILACDMIQDWVERNYPDDVKDPEPIKKEDVEAAEGASAKAEGGEAAKAEGGEATTKAKGAAAAAAEGAQAPPKGEGAKAEGEGAKKVEGGEAKKPAEKKDSGATEAEKKVMENLDKGRIKTSVLKQIIGRNPDYPRQQVGKLTLKKVTLNDKYELIS